MLVFRSALDYNCQIMSAEEKHEQSLSSQVDEVFNDSYGATRKGRIQLAAHALSDYVNTLDVLEDERDKQHGSVGSASPYGIPLTFFGYTTEFRRLVPETTQDEDRKEIDPNDGVSTLMELFEGHDELGEDHSLFTPIEMAQLALNASVDGVRAVYNLSRFQAQKAIRISRKKR